MAACYRLVPRIEPAWDARLFHSRAQRSKRVFDILVASLLLALALPLALVIGLAIAQDTPGPILFSQTRIGKGRRRFRLWKFRSMAADADDVFSKHLEENARYRSEWLSTHKLKNDPRVTRVGRLLRKSSLDELPQLWNVIRGDMSMVGPRPIVEAEIPKYGPAYSLYSQVLPGLTGLWQVSGRTDVSYPERTELDSAYIRSWTLWTDVKLLLKTVPVVFHGHGAY